MESEPKKHCMIVHAYYPIGEPRVQREAEALVDNGYDVDVICLRRANEPPRDLANGVNIYRLPVSRHKGRGVLVQLAEYVAFFILAFWRLTTLYFRQKYATVQLHNPPDFLVFAALIPRLQGARIILDLHDLIPEFYASRFNRTINSWPVRLTTRQEQLSCSFAHHIITVSKPWRQTLIERGVPADKCSVVMNVADDRIFQPTKTEASPVSNASFQLFYHGTLAQRYGIDLVLQSISDLICDMPALHFTIHGRGEYLDELRSLAEDLALSQHIHFSTDYVPIEELPALITGANLAVVPYRRDIFTDGILPTKLMEYAALGVPTIVARTPTIEAYFDSTMVEFFTAENVEELASCIRNLFFDRVRLAQLAKNIRNFNQKYNWTIQKAEYIKVIKTLTEQ